MECITFDHPEIDRIASCFENVLHLFATDANLIKIMVQSHANFC